MCLRSTYHTNTSCSSSSSSAIATIELLNFNSLPPRSQQFPHCLRLSGGARPATSKMEKVHEAVDSQLITYLFGPNGTITPDGQGWIERYTSACVRVLNDHRNDIVSAMGEEW